MYTLIRKIRNAMYVFCGWYSNVWGRRSVCLWIDRNQYSPYSYCTSQGELREKRYERFGGKGWLLLLCKWKIQDFQIWIERKSPIKSYNFVLYVGGESRWIELWRYKNTSSSRFPHLLWFNKTLLAMWKKGKTFWLKCENYFTGIIFVPPLEILHCWPTWYYQKPQRRLLFILLSSTALIPLVWKFTISNWIKY